MKQNKFNLQQRKGYYNNFTYKVKIEEKNKKGYYPIIVEIYNPNLINIGEFIIHVYTSKYKIFHRILKYFQEQIELHIECLILENHVEDDCFTRSGTLWKFK
jgi:hypothetical protein